jgi:hypothetical protein
MKKKIIAGIRHAIENIKGGNTGEKGGYYFFGGADDPDSQFSGMWSARNS